MSDLPIYNCHIHTFTNRHVPFYFLKLYHGAFLGRVLSNLLRIKPFVRLFIWYVERFSENEVLKRQARFFVTGNKKTQERVFKEIERQYPSDASFIVLPMDMADTDLGNVPDSIDQQHDELLELATKYPGRIIPFYAVDPRRENIVERVRENISPKRFRGVKIYPNLGYHPYDIPMEVYRICEARNVPVMTHCTPSGVWKYGLDRATRMELGHPRNYVKILEECPKLRICLAHFGGSEEWTRHLKEPERVGEDRPWVRWIGDLIRSGKYPNLYTDISYTVFTPKAAQLYFDYFDYLKVLLQDPLLREHVLFGSDYYMVKLESLTEREVSITLRSRLDDELYFQIAHKNPQKYLGITKPTPKRRTRKRRIN